MTPPCQNLLENQTAKVELIFLLVLLNYQLREIVGPVFSYNLVLRDVNIGIVFPLPYIAKVTV